MEFALNGSQPAKVAFASGIPLYTLLVSSENKIVRYSSASVCFAVNFMVIAVVSCSRQLHLPRHVYWVGISITVQFCSANWLLEMFLFNPAKDVAICFVYEISIGIFYPSLLILTSLAGLDRYIAIRYYDWYKRKMTNKTAVLAMVSTVSFNALVMNSPYWTGYQSARDCLYDLVHLFCMAAWCVLLGVVNLVLQVKIFAESRRTIRAYFSGQSKKRRNGKKQVTESPPPREEFSNPEALDRIRQKTMIDRLDFRAALLLSANVLPFWICTFPMALNGAAMYLCTIWDIPSCTANLLIKTDAYLKFTTLLPAVCMPIMYMANSKEFKRATHHFFWKIESRASSRLTALIVLEHLFCNNESFTNRLCE